MYMYMYICMEIHVHVYSTLAENLQIHRVERNQTTPNNMYTHTHTHTHTLAGQWMPSLENWGGGLKIFYVHNKMVG